MRFEDEQYARLYKRDTTTWLMLNWQGRCVLPLLLRKVDRAGILDLGEYGIEAIAAHILVPQEVVEEGMKSILKLRILVLREDGLLVWPKFIEAQEAKQSDRARQKAARDRARDLAMATKRGVEVLVPPTTAPLLPAAPSSSDVTPRDGAVTPRDEPSQERAICEQNVTLSSAQISKAEPPSPPGGPRPVPEPASQPSDEPMRELPKSEAAMHGAFWLDTWERAVVAALGSPVSWDPHKARSALDRLVRKLCPPEHRTDPSTWLEQLAPAFVRAVAPKATYYSGYSPAGLERWLTTGRPTERVSAPADARRIPRDDKPPRELQPPPPPRDRETPEQAAERRRRLGISSASGGGR